MSTYEGWTNYETWCVNLWISNDQGSYEYWDDVRQEEDDIYSLSKRLEQEHEELAGDKLDGSKSGVFADLLSTALGNVEWYEIAKSMTEEAHERSRSS